jgi:hypothetical protein
MQVKNEGEESMEKCKINTAGKIIKPPSTKVADFLSHIK